MIPREGTQGGVTADLCPAEGLADADVGARTDLFEVANALAALLDAPVTIEDTAARVIAFSAGQPDDDEVRLRTVLDLREPEDVGDPRRRREMRARVRAAQRPVYLAGAAPNALPRVGMAVRAGNEPLGVIWAVVREPLDDRREHGMVEAAKVVALALLHARVDADAVARARSEQVLALLGGGVTARSTARPLGLDGRPCCVVALRRAPVPGSPEADVAGAGAALHRAAAALNRHLRQLSPARLRPPPAALCTRWCRCGMRGRRAAGRRFDSPRGSWRGRTGWSCGVRVRVPRSPTRRTCPLPARRRTGRYGSCYGAPTPVPERTSHRAQLRSTTSRPSTCCCGSGM